MSKFELTELPLPEHFESFVISGLAEKGMTEQLGFVYDPNKSLVDGSAEGVVLGAGNTYASKPYGVKPLHVAMDLHRGTGLPVVGLATVGAHDRDMGEWRYRDGYQWFERRRGQQHREVMLRLAAGLDLHDIPLHHEGVSQTGFHVAARIAAAGPEEGIDNRTATLYDVPGHRWFPRSLVTAMIIKVTDEYDQRYADKVPAYEEPARELKEYALAHPEIEHFLTPFEDNPMGDGSPLFLMERLGARNITALRILQGLVKNPNLFVTDISCDDGNGSFSTEFSIGSMWGAAARARVADRLFIPSPKGLLHQRADDPAVRAKIAALGIDMPNSRSEMDGYLNSLAPCVPVTSTSWARYLAHKGRQAIGLDSF